MTIPSWPSYVDSTARRCKGAQISTQATEWYYKVMKLEVLDAVSDAGHPVNEDVWGATASAFWVIDGASSVDPESYFSPDSDARWLGDIASSAFNEVLSEPSAESRLTQAVKAAALAVKNAMKQTAVHGEFTPPSAAVTLTQLAGEDLHYFALGDVTLALVNDRTTFVFENRAGLQKERKQLAESPEARTGSAPAHDSPRLAAEIRATRRNKMNRPDGYWILADDPEAANHGWTGHIGVRPNDRLLLASDGFARLVTTFGTFDDWRLLIEALNDVSLADLVKQLRALESSDPERRKYPRMSVQDDATAVYARIVSS